MIIVHTILENHIEIKNKNNIVKKVMHIIKNRFQPLCFKEINK